MHEALLVEALAPVQADELRYDVAPNTADVRRIGIAAMTQPPVRAEQVNQVPDEVDRQGDGQTGRDVAEQPPDRHPNSDGCQQSRRREPPCLRRRLHQNLFARVAIYTVRAENR